MNFKNLSTSEKILLAEQLWESARADALCGAFSEAQRKELESRLSAFEIDHSEGDAWEMVRRRIEEGCVTD